MAFTLEVDPKEKIVKVEVEGALDNTIRMKILSAIALESKSGDCSGAFIDLRKSTFDLSEPIEGAVDVLRPREGHQFAIRFVWFERSKQLTPGEGARVHYGGDQRYRDLRGDESHHDAAVVRHQPPSNRCRPAKPGTEPA